MKRLSPEPSLQDSSAKSPCDAAQRSGSQSHEGEGSVRMSCRSQLLLTLLMMKDLRTTDEQISILFFQILQSNYANTMVFLLHVGPFCLYLIEHTISRQEPTVPEDNMEETEPGVLRFWESNLVFVPD